MAIRLDVLETVATAQDVKKSKKHGKATRAKGLETRQFRSVRIRPRKMCDTCPCTETCLPKSFPMLPVAHDHCLITSRATKSLRTVHFWPSEIRASVAGLSARDEARGTRLWRALPGAQGQRLAEFQAPSPWHSQATTTKCLKLPFPDPTQWGSILKGVRIRVRGRVRVWVTCMPKSFLMLPVT